MSDVTNATTDRSHYQKLPPKRRAFVDAYLRLWNGAAAGREAGYAHPDRQAYRLLRNVEIRAAIEERLAELKMGADEVLIGLAEQARFDPLRFMNENGGIDLSKIKAAGLGSLVKKIYWDKLGHRVVEFHDAQRARQLIGQHHKLFTHRLETLSVDFSKLTDDQLERISAGEDPFEVILSTASRSGD
jgi:hypothetical protein